MAEFITVMREYERMCNSMHCDNCKVATGNNGTGASCLQFIRKFPGKAQRIILQWASEHPIMTNRRKFTEVFGFDVATMFEVNHGNADWLDEEYKDGDNNG